VADDPTVPDDSRLFRRVPADANHVVWDENHSCWRISSQAFRNFKGRDVFSVNLECVLQELGHEPATVAQDTARYGLVALPARLVRAHNQAVERAPEEKDPSHGHVVGDKSKPVMKAFASACHEGTQIQWVVEPQNWPWPAKQS
jgi:hypothetical protein